MVAWCSCKKKKKKEKKQKTKISKPTSLLACISSAKMYHFNLAGANRAWLRPCRESRHNFPSLCPQQIQESTANWAEAFSGSGDLCPQSPGPRQLGNVPGLALWARGPRTWVESRSDPGLLRTLMPTQPGKPPPSQGVWDKQVWVWWYGPGNCWNGLQNPCRDRDLTLTGKWIPDDLVAENRLLLSSF